jgi:hypothetical protein
MPNSPKGDRNIRKLERKECTVKASPRAGRSKKPLEFQRLQSSNRHVKHVHFLESDLGSVVAIGGQRRQAEIGSSVGRA